MHSFLKTVGLISYVACLVIFAPCALADELNDLFITPSDTTSLPATTKVNYLEIHQRAHQTTVVLRLENSTEPSAFLLKNPDRLIIDLPHALVSHAMPKEIKDQGLIQHIRFGVGPEGHGNVRLVFDLAKTCTYALLVDEDAAKATQTLTVILNTVPDASAPDTHEPMQPVASVEPAAQAQPDEAKEPLDLNHLHPNTTTSRIDEALQPTPKKVRSVAIDSSQARSVMIVIDPGHGGKDSGAVGANHLQEKTVVLAISRRLLELLNQQPGMSAKLTRKGDYFISLRERLHLARAYHADLFMAIHADAFNNESASGASVFALSQHGATSEAARWLAERENISEFAGLPFKTTDYQLKSVLLDMSQTATNQDSLSLGASLLRRLTTITPLHARRVEQAGFMVLKSPDTPSVLVETGFISNPSEAALLNDPDFQDKMAHALMQGIKSYCQQNPPPNTYFEMQFKKSDV